jgi:hypothetical protein
MTVVRVLGAPGVYRDADLPLRRLTGVRMDECAFVGVAPRGPAREPLEASPWPAPGDGAEGGVRRSLAVPVDSWTEYVRLYGGFAGPGLLPYAVHTFFQQGGRRAWVVRIVHAYGDARDDAGRAAAPLAGLLPRDHPGLPLRAAAPGDAGIGLTAQASWSRLALGYRGLHTGGLALDPSAALVPGDLLRIETAGGGLRFERVESLRDDRLAGQPVRVAVPADPIAGEPVAVERVRMALTVQGGGGAPEVHAELGFAPDHPRFVGRVLVEESLLVAPDPRWFGRELRPRGVALAPPPSGGPFRSAGPGRPARGHLPDIGVVGDGVWLEARDEGRWGEGLRVTLRLRTEPLELPERVGSDLLLRPEAPVPRGSVLLMRRAGGEREVRTVVEAVEEWHPLRPERVRRLTLDAPPTGDPVRLDRVEADLDLGEEPSGTALGEPRREVYRGLGLSPLHGRWLHRVLQRESRLVRPHPEWASRDLDVTPALVEGDALVAAGFQGGEDRWAEIDHDDFFDPAWSARSEGPGDGIQAVGGIDDVSLLVVPDLYAPAPLPPRGDVTDPDPWAGPDFAPCVRPVGVRDQAPRIPELAGLRLDPGLTDERTRIEALQRAVADFAAECRTFVALLDVPPGLEPDQIVRWRSGFTTDFSAAYHPWTEISLPADGRTAPVRVNPAAVAAGIVARVEAEQGLSNGPANAVAHGVVRLAERVAPRVHGELHPLGINVFAPEPGGIRLTAARTLSRDPSYRQLSVRRLMSMLARVLERQMAWTVFEPNDRGLRGQVTHLLTEFLRELHRANAFVGAAEEDAFFVRCDDTLNPPPVVDAGRLVVEVGVAPAEPTEFLVLRVVRGPDGTVRGGG